MRRPRSRVLAPALAAGHAGVRERLPACVLVCSWPTRSEECVRGTAGMCGQAAGWPRAMRDMWGQGKDRDMQFP